MENSELMQLKNSLRGKSKDELLSIWVANDRHQWSGEAFGIIKQELKDRGVKIPRQKPFEVSDVRMDFRKDVGTVFFPTSETKLIVMSVFTLGFYEIFWFYKNWRFLKEKHNFKVSPFARGFFSVFFCHGLFKTLKQYAQQHDVKIGYNPANLAACYILLLFISRVPEPFDLISVLSFVPLLMAQKAINVLNDKAAPGYKINSRFSGWNILGIVIGALYWGLLILGLIFPEAN